MANTGNLKNPYVTQVFTSGPYSGSEVSPLFTITFNSGSGYISESLCGTWFYNSIFDPINCPVTGFCITPDIISSSPLYCGGGFDYNYIINYNINDTNTNIPNSLLEYSLTSDFSGTIASSSLTNYSSSLNSYVFNIYSSGVVPLNSYNPVYFRMKNVCSGSGESAYSSTSTAVCIVPPPPTILNPSRLGIIANFDSTDYGSHDALAGDLATSGGSSGYVGWRWHLGNFQLWRIFMGFNTSSIVTTPTAVNLWVYSIDQDLFLKAMRATDSIIDIATFSAVDWGTSYSDTPTETSYYSYKMITLNDAAIYDIVTWGVLDIALISNNDAINNPPPGEIEYDERTRIDFSSYPPYLEIIY